MVEAHWPAFLEQTEEHGGLPRFVAQVCIRRLAARWFLGSTVGIMAGRSFWAACVIIGCVALGPSCGDSTEAEPKPGADASTSVSKAIGPAGGELVSADGRARLDVPAGALTSELILTIATAQGAPGGALGPAYDLLPHGTKFAAPVFLSMPIDKQPAAGAYAALAMVIDGQWVPIPGSGALADGSAVTGATRHFSTFSADDAKWKLDPSDPCACDVKAWMGCCNSAPNENPLIGSTWGGGTPESCWCANAPAYYLWDCYEQKAGKELGGCTKCERDCCRDAGGFTYTGTSGCACSEPVGSCLNGCAAQGKDQTKCELGVGGVGGTGGGGGSGGTGGMAGTGGSGGTGGTSTGGAGGVGGTGGTGGTGGAAGCETPAVNAVKAAFAALKSEVNAVASCGTAGTCVQHKGSSGTCYGVSSTASTTTLDSLDATWIQKYNALTSAEKACLSYSSVGCPGWTCSSGMCMPQ